MCSLNKHSQVNLHEILRAHLLAFYKPEDPEAIRLLNSISDFSFMLVDPESGRYLQEISPLSEDRKLSDAKFKSNQVLCVKVELAAEEPQMADFKSQPSSLCSQSQSEPLSQTKVQELAMDLILTA